MSTSRDADKFVIRLPDGIRDKVQARAKPKHISMNSWILQAIDEKLDRDQRAHLAVEAMVNGQDAIIRPLVEGLSDIRELGSPAHGKPGWVKVGQYASRIAEDALEQYNLGKRHEH